MLQGKKKEEQCFFSKCAACDSKKSKFVKQHRANRLLSTLEIKTNSQEKFIYQVLFSCNSIKRVNTSYKLNETVNKVLLAGDKFMHETHLGQPGYMYILLVGNLQKREKDYKNLKEQEIDDIFIKTSQIKVAFNMTWLTGILKI